MRACPKCGASYADNVQFCPTDGSSLGPTQTQGDPRIGTLVDRYRLIDQLGVGGMGVVYRAEHTMIGRPVALKLLHPDLARVSEAVDRFFREARAANEIASDHIVQVTDFGRTDDGANFLVMEFLEGVNLAELVTGFHAVEPRRVVKIALQITEGLTAAHAKGVIHRDLKPANIQLVRRGADADFVKIMDFGIAKIAESNTQLTKTGAILGSPAYMSPEQASGKPIDHRTDIYALGVILFELLTGRPPFMGDSPTQILVAHVTQPPPAPRSLQADVPEALERLVLQCLAKDANDRPQSVQEVGNQLRAWLASQSGQPMAAAMAVTAGDALAATAYASVTDPSGAGIPPTAHASPTAPDGASMAPPVQAVAAQAVAATGLPASTAVSRTDAIHTSGRGGGKGMLWASLAAGVVLIAGGAVAAVLLLGKGDKPAAAGAGSGTGVGPVQLAMHTPGDARPAPADLASIATPPEPKPAAPGEKPGEAPANTEPVVTQPTSAAGTKPPVTRTRPQKPPPRPLDQPAPNKPALVRTTKVSIGSVPPNAAIYKGNKLLGQTPFTVTVKGAPLKLALALRGYKAHYLTVPPDSGPIMARMVQDLPEHKRTRSHHRLKELYHGGQISRQQLKQRHNTLKREIKYKIELIVRRFKRGEISRAERRELVRQIKETYR